MNESTLSTSSWYRHLFYDSADPRIRDYVFFGDPMPVVACYLFYVILCRIIIPMAMKDQQPLKLKMFSWVMKNVILGLSIHFLINFGRVWWSYSWRCQPLDESKSEEAIELVDLAWWYLMSKFAYTFESVIVAFRKDTSIMRDYLLIHHTMLPLTIWLTLNYFPTGHSTFAAIITSLAHAVLFGFKLLCENNLVNVRWMFKYLNFVAAGQTIFQFIAIFGHAAQLFISNDCNYPIECAYIICGSILAFLATLGVIIGPQLMKFQHKMELNNENYLL